METTTTNKLDTVDLEKKVKSMYRDVALNPKGEYHFEVGRNRTTATLSRLIPLAVFIVTL
jgi:hypothetical protein